MSAFDATRVVHLAAQAGVRHSLLHPFDYVDSNLKGLWLVKTPSAAEIMAFPATADYRRRHASDHHDSLHHAARDLPQPRVATPGKPRPPPAGGNPEAGTATAAAPDARPLVLGHPFPPLAALARGAGDRKAGNRHRLAPQGISCILDLEIQARQTRTASGAQGCPRTHPSNVSGEPLVGCSSHPRRTHEAGNRGIGGDGIEVHGAASEATVADVADVPRQPRRLPRLGRFLCGADGHVRRSVRLHRATPRTAAHRARRCYSTPDHSVGGAADPRGLSVGHGTTVYHA